jgi:tRNA(Ile2) C34 agmatinyltransferase TiaS
MRRLPTVPRNRPVSSDDDRPPICPACGVTMGMVVEGDKTHFVCLECGFSEDDE